MARDRHTRSVREELLALADELLSAVDPLVGFPTVVILRRGPARFRVEASTTEMARIRDASRLPEMLANILQALAEAGRAVESKQLAKLAGYTYSSRFRSAMRELQVRGLLVKGPNGYRLEDTAPNEDAKGE